MSDKDGSKHEHQKSPISTRKAKKLRHLTEYLSKQESRNNSKKVSRILRKSEHERTDTEKEHLEKHNDIVKRICKNKERRQISAQRTQELEDSESDLQAKCDQLAAILKKSKKTVIYTGAGISTAASIPDYRGPQGVWTLLKKGEQIEAQDLSDAEPTLTHMCITQLHHQGHVKHVVSQNCDGLHLRSGLPRQVLSEVHGNMFIEVCYKCRPHREYIRLFDVTENTGVRRHMTGRQCQRCGGHLKDTIVHFGEKGGVKSPYRWREAVRAANKCDLILCLGSSLKILKKYACLWCMDRVKQKRPKLVVVNLQWTPKDESATIKINGRCDDVMDRVMKTLGYAIPTYQRDEDPIFHLATSLSKCELESTSKKILERPISITNQSSEGHSRSPTPSSDSDTENSDSDASTISFSSYVNVEDSNNSTETDSASRNDGVAACSVNDRNNELKSDSQKCESEKGRSKTEVDCSVSSLSKSERICNEAKIAMQTKLVSAQISEVYSNCADKKLLNNSILSADMLDSKPQLLNHKMTFDPLKNGAFDPGPKSYEDKLAYLQQLQAQLEDLRQKQRLLKGHEQGEQTCSSNIATTSSNNHKLNCTNLNSKLPNLSASKVKILTLEISNHEINKEKLKRKLHSLEKEKAEMIKEHQRIQAQLLKQSQDAQLRLHQHFLIQEQLLAHSVEGLTRKEDLQKIFMYQQQLLLSQQLAQTEEVNRSHERQLQTVDQLLSRNRAEITEVYSKIRDCQAKVKLAQQQPMKIPEAGVPQEQVSPTKTDFSITSILKTESDGLMNPQSSNNKVVITSVVCESCKFLKDYGIIKRKCQNCQVLRTKNGLCQTATLATIQSIEMHLQGKKAKVNDLCKNQPKSRTENVATTSMSAGSVKSEASTTASVQSGSCPKTIMCYPVKKESESSLSTSLLKKDKSQGMKMINAENPSFKVPATEPTCATIGSMENKLCLTANSTAPLIVVENSTIVLDANSPIDKTSSNTTEMEVKVALETRGLVTEIDVWKDDNETSEKPPTGLKPVRSHSQSEIYEKAEEIGADDSSQTGLRHVRSMSSCEANQPTVIDEELTPTKSDDSLDSLKDGPSSAKKRKVARCLSVPGWFGKGLTIKNVKKKRR